jgi:hypothetical protein
MDYLPSKHNQPWTPLEFAAVLELYHAYGVHPPGHRENIVVKAVARAIGRTTSSVYKRLHNYAACDPHSALVGLRMGEKHGLRLGTQDAATYFFMRNKASAEYQSWLKQARRRLGLQGVV